MQFVPFFPFELMQTVLLSSWKTFHLHFPLLGPYKGSKIWFLRSWTQVGHSLDAASSRDGKYPICMVFPCLLPPVPWQAALVTSFIESAAWPHGPDLLHSHIVHCGVEPVCLPYSTRCHFRRLGRKGYGLILVFLLDSQTPIFPICASFVWEDEAGRDGGDSFT